MNERAFRYPLISILVFAVLMVLPSMAAANEGPRATPQARAAFTAAAPDQTVTLRSEDLVNFEWPSATKAACHGNVSCQPNYPSCASWSGYADCGDPYCGFGPRCGGYYCDEYYFCWWEPGPALKQPRERFRVCFDQYGNSCTEWQQVLSSTCDETCLW